MISDEEGAISLNAKLNTVREKAVRLASLQILKVKMNSFLRRTALSRSRITIVDSLHKRS